MKSIFFLPRFLDPKKKKIIYLKFRWMISLRKEPSAVGRKDNRSNFLKVEIIFEVKIDKAY